MYQSSGISCPWYIVHSSLVGLHNPIWLSVIVSLQFYDNLTDQIRLHDYRHTTMTQTPAVEMREISSYCVGQQKRNQKQIRRAQTAYWQHTCIYHHNSGNQAHPQTNTPKIHHFTTMHADRLHKTGGGLITLIRDTIAFTTTDIPPTINTHSTELQIVKVHIYNISQLKTIIYLLETVPQRAIKQLTRTYNTTYNTSQTYHTQSSPEMWISGTRTRMTTEDN